MLIGGCYCEAIRYETSADPVHPTLCHCVDCRRTAGAPAVAWFTVSQASFRLTAGSPTVFQSSPGATRTFCPACGTALTFASEAMPDAIDVTICSLDDPAKVAPRDHTFARSSLPWFTPRDGLPVFATTRT